MNLVSFSTCPGQDRRFWKPDDIFEAECPSCGSQIEFWKDDVSRMCQECGHKTVNPKFDPGCAQWCPYAEECLGDLAKSYLQSPETIRDRLESSMRRTLGTQPDKVERSLEVVKEAEELVKSRGGESLTVIAAAMLHLLPEDQVVEALDAVKLEDEAKKRVLDLIAGAEDSPEGEIFQRALAVVR